MMNGVNYFSMHRQIMDQAALSAAALKPDGSIETGNVHHRAKLEELKKGSEAFESYFIQSLLKEMRKGVPKRGDDGVGLGKEMYQSMFDEAIAQKITESGGMGLAKLLIEKLSSDLKTLDAPPKLENGAKVFKAISR